MVIGEIKARNPLRDVARRLGIDLPEREGVKFCSPLRPDRNPSCTVHGEKLHDHSRGESFDCIDLVKAVKECGTAEAIAFLDNRPAPVERAKLWPVFEWGTDAELERLSALRGIAVLALEHAREIGFLRFAESKHGRSWIITDTSRIAAQGRLLTGEPWPDIHAKAKTLPGSKAAHPLGIDDVGNTDFIALVEGGPDILAAIECLGCRNPASGFAVVGMLGSSQRIPQADLAKFNGKDVRIYAHADEAGRQAAQRWAGQLWTVVKGEEIADLEGLVQRDGKTVGDVNDLLRISVESYRANSGRVEQLCKRSK